MCGLQDISQRIKSSSPQELPTSCICPHSWSGWQRRGWPGRSISCPKTLRSSQTFALTPVPSSIYPHRSPFSPLPSLMYCLASRHATTESKLWPPGGEERGDQTCLSSTIASGTCHTHSIPWPPIFTLLVLLNLMGIRFAPNWRFWTQTGFSAGVNLFTVCLSCAGFGELRTNMIDIDSDTIV